MKDKITRSLYFVHTLYIYKYLRVGALKKSKSYLICINSTWLIQFKGKI